jgi:short chain dehydrogenase
VELEGKRALVTGGGKGIGRGIVDRFMEEGATVAVAQRSPLDAALDEDEAVVHIPVDLSDASVLSRVVDDAAAELGGLDILVNNAGVMCERQVSEISLDEWERMAATNLRAPLFLAQAALPHLRESAGGSIINIGSVEGGGESCACRIRRLQSRCPRDDSCHGRRPGSGGGPLQRHRPRLDHLSPQRGVPGLPQGPDRSARGPRAPAPGGTPS